ncbi:type 1 glutamine amidotransferase [Streptomyces gardneri]|uniref:type 1 glutamine amidotransferase domain-containing protein n=1 Tax=Nocardia TaxID=1817 RepID=UPI001358B3DA|nr:MULTISPECIES: type 1 glutamine amidotransferase domain-containing protein [Nocardia]MBF6163310.1 type 1 glutamine amidotransferase [Streptomyces gardneri]MBF6202705.1 type 1 glutamine amidotransferase [Streptomyces gardneri]
MADQLDGTRVLIITSNTGVERDELLVPRDELRQRGARVTHAAPKREQVQTFRHDTEKDAAVQPDSSLHEVSVDDFDVLVVPGGTVNADKLRVTDRAIELAKEFAGAGKPIAAICHGPWLLVNAELVSGKTLTSYFSLRADIVNAGGAWVDEPAVRSAEGGWTLLTSRNPGDLPDFVHAITREVVPASR